MDTNTGTTTAASDVIQVLKQPTSEATVVNSAQIPSQSLSVAVMQQAVALQQFQFQQALMMQQILAQQQAASRAVNVKTASELAVARAAEISKLLKGESANDEKGNSDEAGLQRAKSPSRSHGSPSPSHSSGSKLRSPIRYRRDHSRSPIRYRRNRYSPREYRSHRSRGYRGYYRGGHEDYSRSSYRRDWDHARDRDYYYRSRRSRSTSRSRLRRRSPTRSRSPRRHWDRSASPKRDERLSERSSRRHRYRVSKSPAISSRSPSVSSGHGNERKSRTLRDDKRDTCFRRSPSWGSMSPIGKNGNVSIDDAGSSEKQIASDVKPLSEVASLISGGNQRDKRGMPEQDMESREVSSSPAQSLSVSVDRSGSETSKDSKLQGRKSRNVEKESTLLGTKQDLKEAGKEIDDGDLLLQHARQMKNDQGFKFSHRNDENVEDEEEIDDWRNDIKAQAMERLKRRDNKEMERRAKQEEDKKSTSWTSVNPDCSYSKVKAPCEGKSEHRDSAMDMQTDLNEETEMHRGKASSDEEDGCQSSSLKDRVERNRRERIGSEDEEQGSIPKGGDENVKDEKRERTDRQWTSDMLDGEEKANGKDSCAIEAVDSGNEVVIFEGPQPASEISGWPEQRTSGNAVNRDVVGILENHSKREDEQEQADDVGALVMLPEDLEGAEIAQNLGIIDMNDEMLDDVRDGHKSKHRSRSKEKKGKHEDHGGDIRRKDRNKKHQRRHKREEEEDDVIEGKESGRHKEKRKHKKSHRRHDDGRREKKKRKHKHRGRSVSSSSEKSVSSDVGVKEKDSYIVRKKSSQHKRKREPSPTRETSLSD